MRKALAWPGQENVEKWSDDGANSAYHRRNADPNRADFSWEKLSRERKERAENCRDSEFANERSNVGRQSWTRDYPHMCKTGET